MSDPPSSDRSHGYDAAADEFMLQRSTSIGVDMVMIWAHNLPPGAAILDLGCGNGIPIAQTLVGEGYAVYGVDASPRMITLLRQNVPEVVAECAAVEDSSFFNRTFDGVIAWGLLFLLPPNAQRQTVANVCDALSPGGRFLFTAPHQECTWTDVMTGQTSVSLGQRGYRQLVETLGMVLTAEADDSAGNHYFIVTKPIENASAV